MAVPLAADCRYLRRTIDSSRADGPLVCLCEHPIRSGFDCVGPFLEDMPTDCRLWEEPGARLVLSLSAGRSPAAAAPSSRGRDDG